MKQKKRQLRVTFVIFADSSSLSLISKHLVFVDREIPLTGQESGTWLIRWTLVGISYIAVALVVWIGCIADTQVITTTKDWTKTTVAA